jgi:urease accessory protein
MDEGERFLAALQHGDSAFPGGGFAFSWGIEGLVADELVRTVDDLEWVVEDLLLGRWAPFDRVALRGAFAAGSDLDRVTALDREVEAGTLVAGLREGSRRAGRALLGVHVRLATPGGAAYRTMIESGAPGHLAVVQGLVWRGLGLSVVSAETLAAWGLVWALVSAAVRLDVIGHVAAQALLTRLRPRIAALLAAPPPVAPLHAFTPLADIAVARHARRDVRLFTN